MTGVKATKGLIKVVSTSPSGSCDPTNLSNPQPDLAIWVDHVHNAGFGTKTASYFISEDQADDYPLNSAEQSDLAEDCRVLFELGSGQGQCDCTNVN